MGKKNRDQLDSVVNNDTDNEMPQTHLSQIEPVSILTEESPEIIAKRAQEVELTEKVKVALETLKSAKTELKDLSKEIQALLKGEKVKVSTHKYVFVANGISFKDLRTKKDKPLSFQGIQLLELFIGSAPEGTRLEYTREQVLEKLEAYPCLGDKMDNFSWYKSQVFKPMGLIG
jgi:hypothetical protein